MKSFAIVATLGFLQLASALPQNTCPPGTQFHTCSNGYRGCYEESPCDYPAKQDTADPNECPENYRHYDCSNGSWHRHIGCYTNNPCPEDVSDQAEQTPAPPAIIPAAQSPGTCTRNDTLWIPKMHSYATPDSIRGGGSMFPSISLNNIINVMRSENNTKEWRQVAVFRGIPAGARNCSLGMRWNSGGHVFTNLNSGYFLAHRMRELPADGQPMVYENIEPLAENGIPAYSGELTRWDLTEGDNFFQHRPGNLECSEVMAFRLKINAGSNDANWGSLTMEQGVNLGLGLSYTC